jgi:hypothetical protein
VVEVDEEQDTMTPTIVGRIQSRIFVILTVGLLWTLAITPAFRTGFMPVGDAYYATLSALGVVLVLGVVVWDPIYHLLQQFRWEKDWPAMFTLLEGIPEGLVVYLVLRDLMDIDVGVWTFLIHFATTWLIVFAALHGPLRVLFLRWRFRGGRLL